MSNWYHEALIDVTDPAAVVVSGGTTANGEERICLSLPGKRPHGDGWDVNREQNEDLNVLALTREVALIVWEGLDSQFAPERAREWANRMRQLAEDRDEARRGVCKALAIIPKPDGTREDPCDVAGRLWPMEQMRLFPSGRESR